MIVDNFDKIRNLISFGKNKEYFYFCQIIMRKKDTDKADKSSVVLKSIYIDSEECWDKKRPMIKDLCDKTGARAYINITSKSYEVMTKQMLKMISDRIISNEFQNPQTIAEKAAGTIKGDYPIWIVDIDELEVEQLNVYKDIINICEPILDEHKVIDVLITKNGFHILSRPFNTQMFSVECRKLGMLVPDIHKNNPTLLYCNN